MFSIDQTFERQNIPLKQEHIFNRRSKQPLPFYTLISFRVILAPAVLLLPSKSRLRAHPGNQKLQGAELCFFFLFQPFTLQVSSRTLTLEPLPNPHPKPYPCHPNLLPHNHPNPLALNLNLLLILPYHPLRYKETKELYSLFQCLCMCARVY